MQEHWKSVVLTLAKKAILYGIKTGKVIDIDEKSFPEPIKNTGACFVTIRKNRQLRGCIGTLEAYRSLAEDICANAFASAFNDPRFPPVRLDEYEQLEVSISVLTSPEKQDKIFSHQDLIRSLIPFEHGVILSEGNRRATFLPSVWEELPDPEDFSAHLKVKAGFSVDYWSENMKVYFYKTICI